MRERAAERASRVRRVLWWILLANWGVAAAKLTLGLLGGSASLTADGLHSLLDGASNVVGLVAMTIAASPPDAEHPYGHGKFEAVASLAIGGLVGAAAVGLAQMAYGALTGDARPQATAAMIAVTGVTLAVNLAVAAVERRVGRELNSPLLVADAQHTLSDALVSLSVLASLVLVRFGVTRADGVVALGIMGVVALVAWRIAREAIGALVDAARLDAREVEAAGAAVAGVLAVRQVRSRGHGGAVFVDLTVVVAAHTALDAAHAIAHQLEAALMRRFPEVTEVIVHVEPAA
ncbi:MAG: cation transporter [Archangiaceae bacterium]|nr:cation transporter [Archangiaceae bacterium]